MATGMLVSPPLPEQLRRRGGHNDLHRASAPWKIDVRRGCAPGENRPSASSSASRAAPLAPSDASAVDGAPDRGSPVEAVELESGCKSPGPARLLSHSPPVRFLSSCPASCPDPVASVLARPGCREQRRAACQRDSRMARASPAQSDAEGRDADPSHSWVQATASRDPRGLTNCALKYRSGADSNRTPTGGARTF